MQCTLYDNINIPEDRRREIESQYDPKSIWYLRDIKGLRIVAEGLIYRQFADAISTGSKAYAITGKATNLQEIILGVDFGGSDSGHSFTATGITRGFGSVIALGSEWINCQTQEIDPEHQGELSAGSLSEQGSEPAAAICRVWMRERRPDSEALCIPFWSGNPDGAGRRLLSDQFLRLRPDYGLRVPGAVPEGR